MTQTTHDQARRRPPFEAIVRCLSARVEGLLAIYVFGSHAVDQSTRDSDIDLAVLAEGPLEGLERYRLAEKLANLAGRDVDLIDLRKASAVLRSQVITTGHPIYRHEDSRVEAFEDFVYSDYARLNEERAGILADVRERGGIRER